MHGPPIIARTLSSTCVTDDYGNKWQYHSRSDRHAKVAACAMLLDLLDGSELLRSQARGGEIAVAVNHEMRDSARRKKKNLDLVVCTRSRSSLEEVTGDFRQLFTRYAIALEQREQAALAQLPALPITNDVGKILVAFEVKASMTAHVRAISRLYDELDGSHSIVHGAAESALALGLLLVNMAARFISPDRNRHDHRLLPPVVSKHRQPEDALRVIQKMQQLPRAEIPGSPGYEGLAIIGLECMNDGSPTKLVTSPPIPGPADRSHYDSVVMDAVRNHERRFAKL